MSAGERLVVGRVRGFHGLRGTVRVEPLTDKANDRFKAGRTLFVEGSDAPLTIAESGPDAVGWRVRFAEVVDRTAAEKLRDVYLEIVVAPGEQLARGEYYWHQVIGSTVSGLDGTVLGKVTDMYRAGGAEVMLVEGPAGEFDVPLVRPIVRIFAPDRGEIVVDVDALGLEEAETEEEAGEDDEVAGEVAESAGAGDRAAAEAETAAGAEAGAGETPA